MTSFCQYLKEKRSHPDQNPRIDPDEELRKYATDENIFISFTKINKVGINPQSHFSTPLGIYTYPLKAALKKYGKISKFPFANFLPYIQILKLKSGFNVPDVKDLNQTDLYNVLNVLFSMRFFGDKNHDFKKDFVLPIFKFIDDTKLPLGSNFMKIKVLNEIKKYNLLKALTILFDFVRVAPFLREKFIKTKWDILLFYTDNFLNTVENTSDMYGRNIFKSIYTFLMENTQSSTKMTREFAAILRKVGFDGLTDKTASGVIHPNEPLQAVFFSIKPIKHIKTILNRSNDNL